MSSPQPSQLCPTCQRAFVADVRGEFMPFCSQRCKFADLHRWMNESIGLPIGSSEPEDKDEPEPPPVRREWTFE